MRNNLKSKLTKTDDIKSEKEEINGESDSCGNNDIMSESSKLHCFKFYLNPIQMITLLLKTF